MQVNKGLGCLKDPEGSCFEETAKKSLGMWEVDGRKCELKDNLVCLLMVTGEIAKGVHG